MLEIKKLYKQHYNTILNDVNLNVSQGDVVSIECSKETSDSLINLIVGKLQSSSGEIYINRQHNSDYLKHGMNHIGIVLVNEGYYERMTIKSYLKFYSKLLNSQHNYNEIMMKLALLDIGNLKIKHLNESQKKRLSLARERLKDLKLLILQEPILNLDKDSVKIVLNNIEELSDSGVTILNTSGSLKDTILLGGNTFSLNEQGLREIDHGLVNKTEKSEIHQSNVEKTVYKIEKIPVKVDDRIMLFNPMEIDYIESEDGISNLNIRGDKFTCTLSLNELENRLKYLGFFRCHRSYLVNLQRVREIITWTRNSYSLILDDKNKSNIPLSKGRMNELSDILNL